MAKSINDSMELTDVLESVSQKISDSKKSGVPSKLKLTQNQQIAIASGAVLLGGAAFAYTVLSEDGKPVQPNSTVLNNTNSAEPGQTSQVNGGNITPSENIEVAHNVNDSMTFEEAYSSARAETGAGGIFTWHGNVYNTFTQSEWQSMPLEQRQDFLSDVGFKPKVDGENIVKPPVPGPEPVTKEVIIDGECVLAIDQDGDGIVDALIKEEEDGTLTAMVNSDGNGDLDTAVSLDPETGDIIDSIQLDEPITLSMDDVVAMADSDVLIDDSENDISDEDVEEDDEINVSENDTDYDNDSDVSDIS